MSVTSLRLTLAALGLALAAAPAVATPITDPAGDFLSSFAGPHNGDLDVLSAEALFDGVNFTFRSTENGPIGTTAEGLFVWGIDRGLHNQFFGAFRPGVLFDIVVVLRPNLTGTVIDFAPNPLPPMDLPAGSVTVNGDMIQGVVPLSFLQSKGLAPADYQVNLWPRTGLADNTQIADFAPDDSVVGVTTPEPATAFIFLGGIFLLGLSRRLVRIPSPRAPYAKPV